MTSKIIFGFGSLISEESLRATAPNATDIRPAYIKGFMRDFSLWDPLGYTITNLDLAGIPFPSLDVQKTSDPEARVNGVVFTVSNDQDYKQLLIREDEYKLVQTTAYDFYTDKAIGTCKVFSSGKNNTSFDFNSVPAKRYLEVYLQASKQFGDKFYQELLDTTFIDGRPLRDLPELI
jgi:cation transport regulator ChaC